MNSVEKMKIELQSTQEEVEKRTVKFNKSIQKLKDREQFLTSEIEKQELLTKAEKLNDIEILCSQAGMTIEDLKKLIMTEDKAQ